MTTKPQRRKGRYRLAPKIMHVREPDKIDLAICSVLRTKGAPLDCRGILNKLPISATMGQVVSRMPGLEAYGHVKAAFHTKCSDGTWRNWWEFVSMPYELQHSFNERVRALLDDPDFATPTSCLGRVHKLRAYYPPDDP